MEAIMTLDSSVVIDREEQFRIKKEEREAKAIARRNSVLVLRMICVLAAAVSIAVGYYTVSKTITRMEALESQNKELQLELDNTKAELQETKESLNEMTVNYESSVQQTNIYKDSVDKLKETITSQTSTIEKLIDDNESLASEYDKVSAAYDTLKEREELYDKYKYAIMYSGNRTDLTYDQLKYGESLMKDLGLDPNLLFSIGMVESRYIENAKNKYSTATGYHQLLKGTAKHIYEQQLKLGTYNHSMALNGKTNIMLAANCLDYLHNTHSTVIRAIMNYSGRDSSEVVWYISEMNKFLAQVGKSVNTLKW